MWLMTLERTKQPGAEICLRVIVLGSLLVLQLPDTDVLLHQVLSPPRSALFFVAKSPTQTEVQRVLLVPLYRRS